MKSINYKKDFKDLYLPPKKPTVIDVPPMLFATIKGQGNPNDPEFEDAIQALYSVSYGIRMLPKKGIEPKNYYQYTVFPLEGIWDSEVPPQDGQIDKDKLIWEIMIRQPDFVTQNLLDLVKENAQKKKNASKNLSKIELKTITDGLSIQMMHIGPYDDEAKSFLLMDDFCANNGYERIGHNHREIYLSDPRRASPEKMKTVLRYFVREQD